MFKKIGYVYIIVFIVFGGMFCFYSWSRSRLFNERATENGVSANYQRIKDQLDRAEQTIRELKAQQQIDCRTIAELRVDQQQLTTANQRLRDLNQRQADIIQSIASGDGLDTERLDKLEKGIRELPKAK